MKLSPPRGRPLKNCMTGKRAEYPKKNLSSSHFRLFFEPFFGPGAERPQQPLFRLFSKFSRERIFDPCRWSTISQRVLSETVFGLEDDKLATTNVQNGLVFFFSLTLRKVLGERVRKSVKNGKKCKKRAKPILPCSHCPLAKPYSTPFRVLGLPPKLAAWLREFLSAVVVRRAAVAISLAASMQALDQVLCLRRADTQTPTR